MTADAPTPAGSRQTAPDVEKILNPSAVGNLDEVPIFRASPALARLMGRCDAPAHSREDGECGGVNGFHADDCERDR